jgi:hypothetical protein
VPTSIVNSDERIINVALAVLSARFGCVRRPSPNVGWQSMKEFENSASYLGQKLGSIRKSGRKGSRVA